MDLQGWDPGDQWLLRGNWKVLRYNQKADLHPYDVFFGGWKLKGVDSRTNLWSLGKFHPIRRGESKGSSISFRLREFPSRILQSRDLALIKARSQVLSGSRFKGRRMDIIGSALQGKWRHMRRSWLFRISRRWDSGAGGTVWWGLVDWQRVYQGNEKELLLFLQENKRELLLFCFLAHRVSLFTVTLQVYLGNLGMLGLYGGIFWNSWERWIRDRYNNTTTACFFLNIILVWSVKINRSVRVLEMVVEDIIFLVSKWYEQMIDLFGFSYLEVNSREKHYTYTKMRLGVGELIIQFNIIVWSGNFVVVSLKSLSFSLKAVSLIRESWRYWSLWLLKYKLNLAGLNNKHMWPEWIRGEVWLWIQWYTNWNQHVGLRQCERGFGRCVWRCNIGWFLGGITPKPFRLKIYFFI